MVGNGRCFYTKGPHPFLRNSTNARYRLYGPRLLLGRNPPSLDKGEGPAGLLDHRAIREPTGDIAPAEPGDFNRLIRNAKIHGEQSLIYDSIEMGI